MEECKSLWLILKNLQYLNCMLMKLHY
jgi:hypothetical protein